VFELSSLYPASGGDGSQGFIALGIDELDYSGYRVSRAGDVNGDNLDDLLIGAPEGDPNGRTAAGESYVVFGSATDLPAAFPLRSLLPALGGDGSKGFVLSGIDSLDLSSWSVSTAGDVNGDGIDDLVIGTLRADSGGLSDTGESYVVFGRTTGFPAAFELRGLHPAWGGDGSAGFIVQGIAESDIAGRSVSAAGDVNGDGIDDLLIGAYFAGAQFSTPGQAYVVFGRTTGFPALFPLRRLLPPLGDGSEGFIMQGIEPDGVIARSVSGAGDVNGDGLDDVLIGSSNAQANAGESYVVFGRSARFPAIFLLRNLLPENGGDGSTGFVLPGIDGFDFAGYSVSGAGDVNGDGTDDLLIGAKGGDPGREDGAGESYLVFGRTTGFPPVFELRRLQPAQGGNGTEGVIFAGINELDRSGISVSGAGDVNGDGIDDLVIGAYGADALGVEDAGESYVVFGRTTGFPPVFALERLSPAGGGDGSEGFIVAGARIDDVSGAAVSDAGDMNGDGVGDLIIGAFGADPGGRNQAGASYVVFGRTTTR
jgi:hypothetical protein